LSESRTRGRTQVPGRHGLGELLDHAEFRLGAVTARGATEVVSLADSALQVYPDGTPRTRHVTTNLIIEVDEQSGTSDPRQRPLPGSLRIHRRVAGQAERRPAG
jgi:hypothetical protein